jgi:hypothetical protein
MVERVADNDVTKVQFLPGVRGYGVMVALRSPES